MPYVRRRAQDGGRVQNPYFDRVVEHGQELLLEAALYYEACEEHAHSYWHSVMAEEAKNRK